MPAGISMAIPLAISAIKALIRYRRRVDTILSLNETTTGLPFRLPPAPTNRIEHLDAMLAFGKSDAGRIALELHGLTESYERVEQARARPGAEIPAQDALDCIALYFEAADVKPTAFGPGDPQEVRARASSGPSEEMRLAYFVVESHRLSRNPALTRVLLATADTLLEVAGENAGLFIESPRTRGIVESLLEEFALEHDFDDDSAERIFRRLLGAATVAALDNRDQLSDTPALRALFGALSDVREDLGDEFVARLVTRDGFERLVAAYATQVATDPSFLTSDLLARQAIRATLIEFAQSFPAIVRGDPEAVFAILEAGIAVGAAHVPAILERELAGRPLSTAVLSEIARAIGTQAESDSLFESLAKGQVVGELYRAALSAVAANPEALASEAGLEAFAADLVTASAATLSQTAIRDVLTHETFRELAAASLAVMAEHPEVITRDHAFGAKVIAAVFAAAAPAMKDGLQREDVLDAVESALHTAAANVALLDLDDRLESVLASFGEAFSSAGVRPLLVRESRRQALLDALQIVAANPKVWGELAERDLVQPLAVGVVEALVSDPTKLLSGPVFVDATRRVLRAAARRGQVLIEEEVDVATIRILLTQSLRAAEAEVGNSVDGENLPRFLERVTLGFLASPFDLVLEPGPDLDPDDDTSPELELLFDAAIELLERE